MIEKTVLVVDALTGSFVGRYAIGYPTQPSQPVIEDYFNAALQIAFEEGVADPGDPERYHCAFDD